MRDVLHEDSDSFGNDLFFLPERRVGRHFRHHKRPWFPRRHRIMNYASKDGGKKAKKSAEPEQTTYLNARAVWVPNFLAPKKRFPMRSAFGSKSDFDTFFDFEAQSQPVFDVPSKRPYPTPTLKDPEDIRKVEALKKAQIEADLANERLEKAKEEAGGLGLQLPINPGISPRSGVMYFDDSIDDDYYNF